MISLGIWFVLGVNRELKLEENIRKSQKVEETWLGDKIIAENVAVFLFYPEDMSSHIFSINIKSSGLLPQYSFYTGGNTPNIENYIERIYIENQDECVYVSMNKVKIRKIVCCVGMECEQYNLDEKNPFIFICDKKSKVVFYDVNEQQIML